MQLFTVESLSIYWSTPFLAANMTIFFNILGALLLGMLVGYERAYHGRAAGMRTYGLVSMASAALTAAVGYPHFWFGGYADIALVSQPTQVIQGIVTGVGFLGAGLIMKDGFTITGLTSAASIWAASAIGIMVGLGFYVTAVLFGLLSAVCMMWGPRLEMWLPTRQSISIILRFETGFIPTEELISKWVKDRGFHFSTSSLSITQHGHQIEWRFSADINSRKIPPIHQLAEALSVFEGVEEYQLAHARN